MYSLATLEKIEKSLLTLKSKIDNENYNDNEKMVFLIDNQKPIQNMKKVLNEIYNNDIYDNEMKEYAVTLADLLKSINSNQIKGLLSIDNNSNCEPQEVQQVQEVVYETKKEPVKAIDIDSLSNDKQYYLISSEIGIKDINGKVIFSEDELDEALDYIDRTSDVNKYMLLKISGIETIQLKKIFEKKEVYNRNIS